MKKWLAIGTLALFGVLFLLWREIGDTSAATQPAKAPVAPAPTQIAAAPAPPAIAETADEPATPTEPATPQKYDPQSDEFFRKHDEVVIPNVMNSAVKCWENLEPAKRAKFHRSQSIVIKFKQKIVNGTVTMSDPQIERSSINDPALESCFVQQVVATTWHDDKLPDWEQDDQVKISPRVLKKYTRENREATGPDEPHPDRPVIIKGDALLGD